MTSKTTFYVKCYKSSKDFFILSFVCDEQTDKNTILDLAFDAIKDQKDIKNMSIIACC